MNRQPAGITRVCNACLKKGELVTLERQAETHGFQFYNVVPEGSGVTSSFSLENSHRRMVKSDLSISGSPSASSCISPIPSSHKTNGYMRAAEHIGAVLAPHPPFHYSFIIHQLLNMHVHLLTGSTLHRPVVYSLPEFVHFRCAKHPSPISSLLPPAHHRRPWYRRDKDEGW